MTECLVSVIMGSQSDWQTMKSSCRILSQLNIQHEKKIISAHRTPDRLFEYSEKIHLRGIKVIIAGAGGAAHLPGMVASKTCLPVVGVPMMSEALFGIDSVYSILQMPKGCPVATMAIGKPGAVNAALFAASILALYDQEISSRLKFWHEKQRGDVPMVPLDE
tara:strand:+ start:168 stop:656 length:489 start_codon:yes stop_codon:yes gene_type:complete